MTDTNEVRIKVIVDREEAKRRMEEFDRQIEEVADGADQLEKKTRAGTKIGGKASARAKGFAAEDKKRMQELAVGVAAILAIAKTLQISLQAVLQKLEKVPGLGDFSRELQKLSEEVTANTNFGAKLAAIGGANQIASDFAQAGQPLSQQALRGVIDKRLEEANQESIRRDRAASRTMGASVDTFRAFMGWGG